MKYYTLILSFVFLVCILKTVEGQESKEDISSKYFEPPNKPFNFRWTLTAYYMVHGGFGFSIAAGSWVNNVNMGLQPSLTGSANISFSGANIGNAKFYGEDAYRRQDSLKKTRVNPNKMLVTVIFSPMLTKSLDNSKTYMYDEINPFYFGASSAIYNNYTHAITLGTSFVTLPRGTYDNMMSSRNRTQQLVYLQVKSGDFQFNAYEDFLGFTNWPVFQWLCDNRDRYYTGGINLQLRIDGFYKVKYYAETYTGTSYIDKQEYPDVAFPDQKPALKPRNKNSHQKYAYQDPGQQSFNKARNFICIEASLFALMNYKSGDEINMFPDYNMDVQFYIGRIGGVQNMWTQNLIHNMNSIDRDNKDRTAASKLHQFDYRDNYFPKLLIGAGTVLSY